MLGVGSDATDPVFTTLSTWNTALKIRAQNTFFMHQNLDNVFSDFMMEKDTVSLHGIVKTPPVESNVLATTVAFFTPPGPVYLCLCQ